MKKKNETEASNNIPLTEDIIITKSHKGCAEVIINVEDYINKANRQLNHTEFYKEIPAGPTETNRKKVNKTINEQKSAKLLDEKMATKPEVQEAKTPEFYMFPKFHYYKILKGQLC